MEQEMEAVKFRNQQLTRRIQVLQDDRDTEEASAAGHSLGGRKKSVKESSAAAVTSSESLNSVIGQELTAKIEENERLHARLAAVDGKYSEVIDGLQSRLDEVEAERKRNRQDERAEDAKLKELIQGLKAENVELRNKVRIKEYVRNALCFGSRHVLKNLTKPSWRGSPTFFSRKTKSAALRTVYISMNNTFSADKE